MTEKTFWDERWNHSAAMGTTQNSGRVTDARLIPEDQRKHYGWTVLDPCEIYPMFPASTMLSHCESELWRDGESLWVGTIKKGHLEFTNPEDPWSKISEFFKKGLHRSLDLNYQAKFGTGSEGMPDISVELLPKMAWLAHEYILNDLKFDNPMCTHYDPRKNDNIIHPGGMRKVIMELYAPPHSPVDVFYFNTGGFYNHKVMEDLELIDSQALRDRYFDGGTITGCLVADHGTLVPHLMVGSGVIHNRQQEYLTDMLRIAQAPWFKMFFNTPYAYVNAPYLDFLTNDHKEASVVVTIKEPQNHGQEDHFLNNKFLTIGVIHALMNVPYEDPHISVVIKKEGFS